MDEQRDGLGSSRRNRGNRLGIDRDAVGLTLDLNVRDRVRPAVAHGRAIPGNRVLAQHAGDEFEAGDRQVVGPAEHRNDGRRGALCQVRERRPQPRGLLLPVARLHIGHQVDFLLRCLHRLSQRLQRLWNAVEVERLRAHLLGQKQLVELPGIKGHVARQYPLLGAEQD